MRVVDCWPDPQGQRGVAPFPGYPQARFGMCRYWGDSLGVRWWWTVRYDLTGGPGSGLSTLPITLSGTTPTLRAALHVLHLQVGDLGAPGVAEYLMLRGLP